MNKTLYIKEKDRWIWERAEAHAAGKLSDLVTSLLKEFVTEKDDRLAKDTAGTTEGL